MSSSSSSEHKRDRRSSSRRCCHPPIDLILKHFTKGEDVVVSVNQGSLQGEIADVLTHARVLTIRDGSGTYFIPFDNIDYIQTVCSSEIANEKIASLRHSKRRGCDPAGAVADASGGFQ